MAWGPDRTLFDYDDPVGRKGAEAGPVFNSFKNAPHYGDERSLVSLAPHGTFTWGPTVEAHPGDVIGVRIYVHNNANQDTNDRFGIAHNTRVRLFHDFGTVGSRHEIAGYVSADNATPRRVYHSVPVTSASPVALSYVPGSAQLHNNGPFKDGISISDDLVGPEGALIGYDALDGVQPGCFQFAAVVTAQVKVAGA